MTVLKTLLETDLNNAQIAALLGVSRERIRQIREKRELPDGVVARGRPKGAQNKPRTEPPALAHGKEVPEDILAMLGKVPDRVVAEKVGRSVPWVVQLRKKKGITSTGTVTSPRCSRAWVLSRTPTWPPGLASRRSP